MWILPTQLHTLAFALDTEALISDSNEQSQICAQSLLVRSKHSPARTWSAKWKRDSWTQHLSGRILKPSHGQSFVTAWISLVADTPASHSAQPESVKEQKTQDTSGLLFQPELLSCDRVAVSLKTSRDISRWGCPTLSKTWQEWVTERRGAYSARLKSAHLTNASGSSSWPTVTANEDSCRIGGDSQQSKCLSAMARRGELAWPTPQEDNSANNAGPSRMKYAHRNQDLTVAVAMQRIPRAAEPTTAETRGLKKSETAQFISHPAPANGNTDGSRPERLNPRWVETLMGLPVGWVMPSCASPVIPALTNCAASGMALCQQPQSELFVA
jgi:hypothetical protein